MSYDYPTLVAHVQADLRANPRVTLRSICRQRQVDRHTVDRALTECLGANFSQLKEQVNLDRIQAALTDGQMKSVKQAALDAGYGSSAALAKRTRKTLGLPPTAVRRRGGKLSLIRSRGRFSYAT